MSLFKSRSGNSLFKINNLKGFIKYLADNNNSNIEEIEKITNKMGISYVVINVDENRNYNKMTVSFTTKRNGIEE